MSVSSAGYSHSFALPTDKLLELLLNRKVGVMLSPVLSVSILLIIPELLFFNWGEVKENMFGVVPCEVASGEEGGGGDFRTSK